MCLGWWKGFVWPIFAKRMMQMSGNQFFYLIPTYFRTPRKNHFDISLYRFFFINFLRNFLKYKVEEFSICHNRGCARNFLNELGMSVSNGILANGAGAYVNCL